MKDNNEEVQTNFREINSSTEKSINLKEIIRDSKAGTVKFKKKNNKKGLITTIVLAILVLYMGIYTVVVVFVLPEVDTGNQNIFSNDVETLSQISSKIKDYVPYQMYKLSAYQMNETKFENLDMNVIYSYTLDTLANDSKLLSTSDQAYIEANCTDQSKKCFSVNTKDMISKIKEMYNKDITTLTDFTIDENGGVCNVSGNIINCNQLITLTDTVNGKVGKTELIKKEGKDVIIYEKAFFIDNLTFEGKNATFNKLLLMPIDDFVTMEKGNIVNVTRNTYKDVFFDQYGSTFYYFKHVFKEVDGNYYWYSTDKVESLN